MNAVADLSLIQAGGDIIMSVVSHRHSFKPGKHKPARAAGAIFCNQYKCSVLHFFLELRQLLDNVEHD